MRKQPRSLLLRCADCVTFPVRALTLFYNDWMGLSSLASERYEYVASEVTGHTLDIGCGRNNRFIKEYLGGNGVGIDVFPYEGLSAENMVPDMTALPFAEQSFESVTFIANLNHVPQSVRDAELKEAFRVLRPGGNIAVTMGHPVAEILVHKVVYLYDRLFSTNFDMDSERGMDAEEAYFLTDGEIIARLGKAGFMSIRKRYFWTQWGLNHVFVGWKK